MLTGIYNALSMEGLKVVWTTIPLLFQYAAFTILYTVTDWAWINPGYALLIMFPTYSLVNSKQIVCNFTKMNMSLIPASSTWFLLFPINKYAVKLFPKL